MRLLALACTLCLVSSQNVAPELYRIDLDGDPTHRWDAPVTDYKEQLLEAFYWLTDVWAPLAVYEVAYEIAKTVRACRTPPTKRNPTLQKTIVLR